MKLMRIGAILIASAAAIFGLATPAMAGLGGPAIPWVNGDYTGTYTTYSGTYPLDIYITQSGDQLGGQAIMQGSVLTSVGTVNNQGKVHLVENNFFVLDGSKWGDQLLGTWSAFGSTGSWHVTKVKSVRGSYLGSFTTNGSPLNGSMNLTVTQVGGVLGGSMSMGGGWSNYGSVTTNTIIGMSGGQSRTLVGTQIDPQDLGGSWSGGGSSGTWSVWTL
jgi:hypothetical protein